MTTNQPNGVFNNLPCDEGDLLAYVEGEALGAGGSGAVARALDRDPALAARVRSMKADRHALATLADAKAPAGLVEAVSRAVEGTLERRMLLGLEREAPVEALPRATPVRVRRPSPVWSIRPATWRLAMAAGLLLVVGGGVFWAIESWPKGETGPIALGPENTPDPIALKTEESVGESTIAAAPETSELSPTDPEAVPETSIASTAIEGVSPSVASDAAPVRRMALATALELAREGRLLIVVEAKTPPDAAERIDALAARGPSAGPSSWRVQAEVPSAMVAMIEGMKRAETPLSVPSAQDAEPPVISSVRRVPVPFRPYVFATPPAPRPIIRDVDRVYLAETRLNEAALESLLGTLSAGNGWEASFQAAPEAVADACDVLSPAAVLWWTQPPSGWVDWASVPVVIRRAPTE